MLSFSIAPTTLAPEVTTRINTAFRSEPTGQTWLFSSQTNRIDIFSLEATLSILTSPSSIFLAATLPNTAEMIATCFLRKPAETVAQHISKGAAWLGFLAVKPAYHGQGYGKAMLQEAERFVREEWGAKRLEMDHVNARVELGNWYRRCGYNATGKKRDFVYGDKGREIFAAGLELLVVGKDLVMN
ncbi:unnamed protein product [Aureobasidium uvarum]|uniref:N-acetyltransferase domain-containing protein n=1 Tax=Aureobasidium uvarum TaxID=2773716 RepID=A0A9N8KFB8_9PEZI|nr:unnamed protein product [Aureobasidium uvarum]